MHQAIITLILAFQLHAAFGQCLSSADLDTCKIYKSLSSIKGHEDQVYRVDLSKKKLDSIPHELFNLPHLQELKFNKNNLTTLPPQITRWKELQRIEIEFNALDTLPPYLFELHHLKKVDFGYNFITSIPDQISELHELEILALWDNPIFKYSRELIEMPQLKHLDFSNNFMSESVQNALREGLPHCKLYFPMPCQCEVDW
jgi:Leucine-rich repeat (LRR) protein